MHVGDGILCKSEAVGCGLSVGSAARWQVGGACKGRSQRIDANAHVPDCEKLKLTIILYARLERV